MTVKILELIGTSPKSFENAIEQAIKRTSKTIRGITGVDVVGQTAVVENGKVAEFRVNMKIAFTVED
ncbi:dodecin domain-containing protein [Candidatus Falkowbacteria bacterium]|nr:dodecin domain-containing protein [Candidatus Falkowbacteria bacterium]